MESGASLTDPLVERLAREPAGHLTVLTPNTRLADALVSAVDRWHLARGRTSWPAPDVLTLGAWLGRLHEEARFADGEPLAPALSAGQALLLWEEAIAKDGACGPLLASPGSLAREAQKAWALANDWGFEGAIGHWDAGPDAQAFARWAATWQDDMARRGWVDAAGLSSRVPALLARPGVRRPASLVAYAFHLVTPAQRFVLDACRAAGIAVSEAPPPGVESLCGVFAAATPGVEIEVAARWARSRLEAARGAAPRIGVVVPDLAQRRDLVARTFERVLAPNGHGAGAPLYNLSLGRSLASCPIVDAALGLLELSGGEVPFERASRMLRSPFLGEGLAERWLRARLDAALRRIAPPALDLALLLAIVREAGVEGSRERAPACAALERRLAAMAAVAPPGRLSPPHAWAEHFSAVLAAAGFPGDRPLDSAEHQALARWHEALSHLVSLGAVTGGLTREAARRQVRQWCAEALFQPESGDAPVQVLGLLESVGLSFDALWVAGLTDEAWPQSPRPDPFLPTSLQRKAGVPQASAEASLDLDRRITLAWSRAAPEVVFSHARLEDERDLAASPLLAGRAVLDEAALGVPAYPTRAGALFKAGRDEGAWRALADRVAPPHGGGRVRGGTAVLADQAACPFRAFARHRLGAARLESVEPGLTALDRGQLLHALLARVWRDLGTQAAFLATEPSRLEAIVAEGARAAVAKLRADRPGRLEGRLAQLERERLAGVALEWLAIDRSRPPFEVIQREESVALAAGGLDLQGRIDRLDRLDGGDLAVIDYKAGLPSVAGWMGDRPEEPQLPLYALANAPGVAAVAFAQLKKGKRRYIGIARDDGLIPGVPAAGSAPALKWFGGDWAGLLAQWREATDRLGRDFGAGDARVDPKRGPRTCERCDLGALCRVRERLPAAPDEDGAEEPAESEDPS